MKCKFFATDHRLVVATLKLYVKSRKPPRYDFTVIHFEKLKDFTCAEKNAMTVCIRFGVLDKLDVPLELWDTFKHET